MDHPQFALAPDTLIAENIYLSIAGRDILKGVTIRAERGYVTGLLGRNGSGKSTMLQAIFGTRTAAECDVFINGLKVKKPYAMNGLVNYLPQQPFLPAGFTLRKVAHDYGVATEAILQHFPALGAELDKQIRTLSGGIERLFSVIILLLADTRFSLLDEPFSHVMPLHIDGLSALILQQKEKKGIIITDHMYRHLLPICDRLLLMKEGKSISISDNSELVLHGYIRDLQA